MPRDHGIDAPERNGVAKVLLVANTSWYLLNFRRPLAEALQAEGYQLTLVAPTDAYSPALEAAGFRLLPWPLNRRSINPLQELLGLLNLVRLYRQEQPDLVHHFTIKACLYGTIAAKVSGVRHVINAVTGLGHVFLGERRRTRLLLFGLRPLYRAVFRARRGTVVFQNAADQERLIQMGLASSSRTCVIRSSGVDLQHFRPDRDNAGHFSDPPRLLFPSRLIREKGTSELLLACRQLRDTGLELQLLVAGTVDEGNRSALSLDELSMLRQARWVTCLGHVEDMRSLYNTVDVVVLPSWREGLSRALIEAAAMERPIITTDVPGCRDVVEHGRSGLLVPPRDPHSLALALQLLHRNPELARRLGKAARKQVEQHFGVEQVNASTLRHYHRLLGTTAPRTTP